MGVELTVRLYEFQGKRLLQAAGVSIPDGDIASDPQTASAIAEKVGKPVAIKAQIWATGRLKAGGIRFADNPSEAKKIAAELLGLEIKGFKVDRLLIEERLDVRKEFYVGIIIDDSYKIKGPVVMFSTRGGTDIEAVATESPELLTRVNVTISTGIQEGEARNLVSKLVESGQLAESVSGVILKLYEVFRKYDARSVEINPLVLTSEGRIIASDCRITIDDSSIQRHSDLMVEIPRESSKPLTELDRIAWKIEENDYRGVAYFMQLVPNIEEQGFVGFHGMGGGGAMLGADALVRHGLRVANYADTSGNPTASKVYRCAKVILQQPGIEAYVVMDINISSQEMWHSARGLARAFREELAEKPGFPVVIVWGGNKVKESTEIMKEMTDDLPIKLEMWSEDPVSGPHYNIYDVDPVVERTKELIEQYRESNRRRLKRNSKAKPAK
jgi:succinyl-CoA synthetase beta subunit